MYSYILDMILRPKKKKLFMVIAQRDRASESQQMWAEDRLDAARKARYFYGSDWTIRVEEWIDE